MMDEADLGYHMLARHLENGSTARLSVAELSGHEWKVGISSFVPHPFTS